MVECLLCSIHQNFVYPSDDLDFAKYSYLVKQDKPFKQVRSLAHPTVSEWHLVKKQFPSTLTECPAAANFASSSSAALLTTLDPIIAGTSAIAMKARRVWIRNFSSLKAACPTFWEDNLAVNLEEDNRLELSSKISDR